MSNRKRCPNCAWAFWHARNLALPSGPTLLLIAIAELVDINLHYFATLAQLEIDTRISSASLREHIQVLIEAECIRTERTRGGYHYYLERPVEAFSRPEPFEVEWPDVAEEEPQNSQFQHRDDVPEPAKIEVQEPENLAFPLMKTPLKIPKEECSLRSPRAREVAPVDQWEMAFKAFYALYPRRVGVDRARKAFFTRMKAGVSPDDIITGLKGHRFSAETRYIPHPSSWLNAGCWRDEVADDLDPALVAAGVTREMLEQQRQQQQAPFLAIAGGRP